MDVGARFSLSEELWLPAENADVEVMMKVATDEGVWNFEGLLTAEKLKHADVQGNVSLSQEARCAEPMMVAKSWMVAIDKASAVIVVRKNRFFIPQSIFWIIKMPVAFGRGLINMAEW